MIIVFHMMVFVVVVLVCKICLELILKVRNGDSTMTMFLRERIKKKKAKYGKEGSQGKKTKKKSLPASQQGVRQS